MALAARLSIVGLQPTRAALPAPEPLTRTRGAAPAILEHFVSQRRLLQAQQHRSCLHLWVGVGAGAETTARAQARLSRQSVRVHSPFVLTH